MAAIRARARPMVSSKRRAVGSTLPGVGCSDRRHLDGIFRLNRASRVVQIVNAADGGSSVW